MLHPSTAERFIPATPVLSEGFLPPRESWHPMVAGVFRSKASLHPAACGEDTPTAAAIPHVVLASVPSSHDSAATRAANTPYCYPPPPVQCSRVM